MDKVKKRSSLKWSFVKYIPVCLALSWFGLYLIGTGTNELQDWYQQRHSKISLSPSMQGVAIRYDGQGNILWRRYGYNDGDAAGGQLSRYQVIYWLISYGQVLWGTLWVMFCVGGTGIVFYNRELRKPITMLMDASHKISENNLDFSLDYKKENEMGLLCRSFEDMRRELDKNNRKMWDLLEERRRLNRAFSHDLRTPLTVLRGYTDFLTCYVPDGRVSTEKMTEILSMINGQVERLENYTEKMTAVQKLSELNPDKKEISGKELLEKMRKSGEMLCGGKTFSLKGDMTAETLFLDEELVMEVYENLVSNGARFARTEVTVTVWSAETKFLVTVEDNGNGFSEEGLRLAADPFYRGDKENDKAHFGMGLYIGKILCERCGGRLVVENGAVGGKVTAIFC
ncbi:MAG: HAMP domain-containing histidine kinase [Alistipes sp.]|nr:HAMP domain-containing histidine kinase [Alistipes sp.]